LQTSFRWEAEPKLFNLGLEDELDNGPVSARGQKQTYETYAVHKVKPEGSTSETDGIAARPRQTSGKSRCRPDQQRSQ